MAARGITFHFAPPSAVRLRTVSTVLGQTWTWTAATFEARRTRRLLREMDDRQLADIGISRGQAHTEAARAPWDLAPPR